MRVERGSSRKDVTQEMNKTITFSLIIVLIVPVAAYSVFCTYLWAAQDRHIFWPSREIVQKPSDYGLEYEDVFIRVPSENRAYEALHAWWIPAEGIPNQRVLLYRHGSAINISANVEHARRFHLTRPHSASVSAFAFVKWAISVTSIESGNSCLEAILFIATQESLHPTRRLAQIVADQ